MQKVNFTTCSKIFHTQLGKTATAKITMFTNLAQKSNRNPSDFPTIIGIFQTNFSNYRLYRSSSEPKNTLFLLIYCQSRYLLILQLLIYFRPCYIFFAQHGNQKGGVPVVQFNGKVRECNPNLNPNPNPNRPRPSPSPSPNPNPRSMSARVVQKRPYISTCRG